MTESIKHTMSKRVITIPIDCSVSEAEQLMKDRRIRHLPVVDALGQITGLYSKKELSSKPVLQTHFEFIQEDTNLRSAVLKMLQMKLSCLLVANDNGTLTGIVTTDDLLWCLAELLHKEEDAEKNPYNQFKERAVLTIGDLANRIANIGI